jgi:IS4 transposase
MPSKSIVKIPGKTSKFPASLESAPLKSIRKILPDQTIQDACHQVNYNYRKRFITPIVTVLHMILAAIWPEESFNASWELLWSSFIAGNPSMAGKSPSRGTVSNARKRMPLEAWNKIAKWLSEQGQAYSDKLDQWHGHRVVAVDGTCMTAANTKELCETFGLSNGNTGPRFYPLIRMVCLSIVDTMIVINYRIGSYRTDENTLLKPMLKTLRKGDILMGDRHFAGSNLYWQYMQNGLEYITRKHQRVIVSRLRRLWSYEQNDFVAKVKISDVYRHRNPNMPKYIRARFNKVNVRIRGKAERIWLVTSLLERKYPADEIAKLYMKRWSIETLFEQFKINLSADILRSQSVCAVRKEIVARMCAINIVHTLMLEAAIAKKVDASRISFVYTVRAVVAFAPALKAGTPGRLKRVYNAMLYEIAAHLVPFRPGRLEPRRLAHDPRSYPKLKTTRAKWRKQNAA